MRFRRSAGAVTTKPLPSPVQPRSLVAGCATFSFQVKREPIPGNPLTAAVGGGSSAIRLAPGLRVSTGWPFRPNRNPSEVPSELRSSCAGTSRKCPAMPGRLLDLAPTLRLAKPSRRTNAIGKLSGFMLIVVRFQFETELLARLFEAQHHRRLGASWCGWCKQRQ